MRLVTTKDTKVHERQSDALVSREAQSFQFECFEC